mmetsp:Transcript_155637/g.497598  ORF Transcript_155637/g.497598 Transcript_155637/m.497598 type:complete len:233 (+) Transcript_155637:113-811(+)
MEGGGAPGPAASASARRTFSAVTGMFIARRVTPMISGGGTSSASCGAPSAALACLVAAATWRSARTASSGVCTEDSAALAVFMASGYNGAACGCCCCCCCCAPCCDKIVWMARLMLSGVAGKPICVRACPTTSAGGGPAFGPTTFSRAMPTASGVIAPPGPAAGPVPRGGAGCWPPCCPRTMACTARCMFCVVACSPICVSACLTTSRGGGPALGPTALRRAVATSSGVRPP